jgi:hypothetical protein
MIVGFLTLDKVHNAKNPILLVAFSKSLRKFIQLKSLQYVLIYRRRSGMKRWKMKTEKGEYQEIKAVALYQLININ